MSKRCDITIFLIAGDSVYRADFSGRTKPQLINFSTNEVRADDSIADAVSSVKSKFKIGRRVLVLSTDVWTQIIELPTASVDGVSEAELTNAIRFEIESLCGIDADKSIAGFEILKQTSESTVYRVVATEQFEFDALSKLLSDQGATRIQLGHPIGADLEGEESDGTSPRSLQLWPNLVAVFDGNRIDRLSIGSDDVSRWKYDLGLTNEDSGKGIFGIEDSHFLNALKKPLKITGSNGAPIQIDSIFEQNNTQRLEDWFCRVATTTVSAQNLVAIAKQRPESAMLNQMLVRLAFVGLTVGLCAWHYQWMSNKQSRLASEFQKIEAPSIEKRNNDAKLLRVLEEQKSIKDETQLAQKQLNQIDMLLNNQSDRLVKLLELIVQHRTEDIKVETITPNEFGLVIGGISLNSDSPQTLANRLRPETEDLGWKVNPATQDGLRKMTSGGPWTFEILLEDVEPILKLETANRSKSDERF